MSTETHTINPSTIAASISADAPATPEKTQTTAAQTPPAGSPTPIPPDSLGRAFDPQKFRLKDGKPHLDTRHRFVPLGGGRKRKTAPSSHAATPPPAPPQNAWTEQERADAQKPPNAPDSQTAPPPADMPEAVTPTAARRATARAGTRLLYTGTGIVTGNPEDAIPPPKEDKDLQDTATYILDATGWRPSPLIAFAVMLVTYVVYVASRPRNHQALTAWWRGNLAKKVTPAATAKTAPADATPAHPATIPGGIFNY